jgi:hypothetical protein
MVLPEYWVGSFVISNVDGRPVAARLVAAAASLAACRACLVASVDIPFSAILIIYQFSVLLDLATHGCS